jgi:hypothetical protein
VRSWGGVRIKLRALLGQRGRARTIGCRFGDPRKPHAASRPVALACPTSPYAPAQMFGTGLWDLDEGASRVVRSLRVMKSRSRVFDANQSPGSLEIHRRRSRPRSRRSCRGLSGSAPDGSAWRGAHVSVMAGPSRSSPGAGARLVRCRPEALGMGEDVSVVLGSPVLGRGGQLRGVLLQIGQMVEGSAAECRYR